MWKVSLSWLPIKSMSQVSNNLNGSWSFVEAIIMLLKNVFFRHSAENRADLSTHHITHVLNAAHSKRRGQPHIYEGLHVAYMGIEAHDSCDFDMSVNFQAAADFIHRALSRGGAASLHFKR